MITLAQPIIWLLLFGALFKTWSRSPASAQLVPRLLTPGVLVMTAFFSSGWSGMA